MSSTTKDLRTKQPRNMIGQHIVFKTPTGALQSGTLACVHRGRVSGQWLNLAGIKLDNKRFEGTSRDGIFQGVRIVDCDPGHGFVCEENALRGKIRRARGERGELWLCECCHATNSCLAVTSYAEYMALDVSQLQALLRCGNCNASRMWYCPHSSCAKNGPLEIAAFSGDTNVYETMTCPDCRRPPLDWWPCPVCDTSNTEEYCARCDPDQTGSAPARDTMMLLQYLTTYRWSRPKKHSSGSSTGSRSRRSRSKSPSRVKDANPIPGPVAPRVPMPSPALGQTLGSMPGGPPPAVASVPDVRAITPVAPVGQDRVYFSSSVTPSHAGGVGGGGGAASAAPPPQAQPPARVGQAPYHHQQHPSYPPHPAVPQAPPSASAVWPTAGQVTAAAPRLSPTPTTHHMPYGYPPQPQQPPQQPQQAYPYQYPQQPVPAIADAAPPAAPAPYPQQQVQMSSAAPVMGQAVAPPPPPPPARNPTPTPTPTPTPAAPAAAAAAAAPAPTPKAPSPVQPVSPRPVSPRQTTAEAPSPVLQAAAPKAPSPPPAAPAAPAPAPTTAMTTTSTGSKSRAAALLESAMAQLRAASHSVTLALETLNELPGAIPPVDLHDGLQEVRDIAAGLMASADNMLDAPVVPVKAATAPRAVSPRAVSPRAVSPRAVSPRAHQSHQVVQPSQPMQMAEPMPAAPAHTTAAAPPMIQSQPAPSEGMWMAGDEVEDQHQHQHQHLDQGDALVQPEYDSVDPHFTPRLGFHHLREEHRDNQAIRAAVSVMSRRYAFWRATHDDGNSFFRALFVGFLEHCIQCADSDAVLTLCDRLKTVSESEPVREWLVTHFVKPLMNVDFAETKCIDILDNVLAENTRFDSMVVLTLRRKTAEFIRSRAGIPEQPDGLTLDEELMLSSDHGSVGELLRHQVLQMGVPPTEVIERACMLALGMCVRVTDLTGPRVSVKTVNGSRFPKPVCHLLRSDIGQYDCLIPLGGEGGGRSPTAGIRMSKQSAIALGEVSSSEDEAEDLL